ncbi:MAG: DUF4215 domain-containing protein [Nanoarchaeota archaeon]
MSLVLAVFLVSCAPKLTEEEALAELDGLSAEELNAVMAEDSGAVAGQAYQTPQLKSLKTAVKYYFTWLSCTDSDGGIKPANKGELTLTYDSNGVKGEKAYPDSCVDSDTLKEYYCVDNKFSYQGTKCPNGCKDGACLTAVCGDGVIQANLGEFCDDGNAVSGDGCSATCQKEQVQQNLCGNGITESPEQCDDGNMVSGDGCSATCQMEGPIINNTPSSS